MDGQVRAVTLRSPRTAQPSSRLAVAERAPARAPRSRVRAEIQALRAVAVSLVLVYHLWPAAVPGGYVGVDVFFAISGFLITSLLLREAERGGRISLAGFWARRARRILPAALVTVLACAIATMVLVPLTQLAAVLRRDARQRRLRAELAARRRRRRLPRVRQRAVAGPALLVAVGRGAVLPRVAGAHRGRARRHARPRAGAATPLVDARAGAATALSLALLGAPTPRADPAAAYFVTPTRAWELGAGALLALAGPFDRSPAALRAALSWLGLAAIAVAALRPRRATPFPGTPRCCRCSARSPSSAPARPRGRLAPPGCWRSRPFSAWATSPTRSTSGTGR